MLRPIIFERTLARTLGLKGGDMNPNFALAKRPLNHPNSHLKKLKNCKRDLIYLSLMTKHLGTLNFKMAQLNISKALIHFSPHPSSLLSSFVAEEKTQLSIEEIICVKRRFLHIKRSVRQSPHLHGGNILTYIILD